MSDPTAMEITSDTPMSDAADVDGSSSPTRASTSSPIQSQSHNISEAHVSFAANPLSPSPTSHRVQPSSSPTMASKSPGWGGGGSGMNAMNGASGMGREKDFGAPGSAWMNKKHKEEMDRMMEHVVDREFSMMQYGDVLLRNRQNGR